MAETPGLEKLRALLLRSGRTGPSPQLSSLRRETKGLPWHASGLGQGEVSEWISLQEGSGEAELALSALRLELSAESRWLVVDPAGEGYAPALENMGVTLKNVLFVRTREPMQALWAVEQGLRSSGLDAVVFRMPKVPSVVFRRLKLAAEAGNSRCLLLRGAEALKETSWADIRLLVSALPSPSWKKRRFRVETLKLRNGVPGVAVQVERDDETGSLRVVSELGGSAGACQAAGA